jgi:hypothetical protein
LLLAALFVWFIALAIPFFGVSAAVLSSSVRSLERHPAHRDSCSRYPHACRPLWPQVINDLMGAFCVTFET